jgi:NADH-quinone oxidoreductase subunit J
MMELAVFLVAAAMILLGGLGVITRSHPVHAALSLVLTLFGVAVLFVAQHAHFLAAVQVIVYAGAIVVLFLFVIMLLGVDRVEDVCTEPIAVQRWLAGIVGIGLLGLLAAAIVSSRDAVVTRGPGIAEPGSDPVTAQYGDENVQAVARSLFSDYVVAFEVTGVLLVVAVVGTVVLTRRVRKPVSEEVGS